MSWETFDKINKRRHELINKKFGAGLSVVEEKIFDRIQNHTMEAIEENLPGMNRDFRHLEVALAELKRSRRRIRPKGTQYVAPHP